MINLIKNEWMKIFKRPGTIVMITILIVAASITAGIMKYQQGGKTAADKNWVQNLQEENTALKKQVESSHTKAEKDYYQQTITTNDYRVKHNIPPQQNYDVWTFVKDASQLISFVGLFTIIVSAGIVASEFNWGTIKLLLIRPINRNKILLSKYLTVLMFAIFLLVILFVYSTAIGASLFGLPDKAVPYLNYNNGTVSEQNMVVHLMIYYGINSITMIMLTTMAFMISSVFRNSSLAIGLSIFFMFTGTSITQLLAMNFSWAKYILFANTNLMQYFEGSPMVEGMTMSFSITVLIVYFLIFQLLSFFIFKKRDVAA